MMGPMGFLLEYFLKAVTLNDELCTSDSRVKEGSLVERRSAYMGGMCICFHYSQNSIVLCMLSVSFEKRNTQVINQAGFQLQGGGSAGLSHMGLELDSGLASVKTIKLSCWGLFFLLSSIICLC